VPIVPALGHRGGDVAGEEAGLLGGEDELTQVVVVVVVGVVDDGEVLVGVGLRRGLGGLAEQEADRDDQVAVLVDELLDVGLEVGLRGGLEHRDLDAELLLGALHAGPGGLVEGAVVDATLVGDQAATEVDVQRLGSRARCRPRSRPRCRCPYRVGVVSTASGVSSSGASPHAVRISAPASTAAAARLMVFLIELSLSFARRG
jgi:hypothetical protein